MNDAPFLVGHSGANYENAEVSLPENPPQTLPVTGGMAAAVALQYAAPQKYLTAKGQGGGLKAVLDLPQSLAAPVAAGQAVGSVQIFDGQSRVAAYPVAAAEEIPARSFAICVERCTIFGGSFRHYILYFIQPIILYIGLNNTIGFFKTHYIIIWQFTPTVFS